MKFKKQFVIGLVTSILLAVVIIACNNQKVDPLRQFNLNSNEKQVLEVVQRAFDQETQKLVTGKEPDLSMFESEKASRNFDLQVFKPGEYLLEKASGFISDPIITETATGYKIHLQYLLSKKLSNKELSKYEGIFEQSEDQYEYDFYLEKVDGIYKITSVKLYTDADIPSNYVPLDDEGQMFSGRNLGSDGKARISYTYNRTAASNYAKSYTINNNSIACNGYNPAYKCYSSDCANLVSQSLKAGGVTFNNAYTSSSSASSWWYNTNSTSTTNDDVASISWTTANGLYNHVIGTGIGTITYNMSEMKLGDLVFAKWVQKNGSTCYYNSSYDHVMIVTALKKSGGVVKDVYLTYHTNDRKDKLLGDIITQSTFNDCDGNYCAVPVITKVKMSN